MSSNNVTITEQGHLIVGNIGVPAVAVPALRAHFAAEIDDPNHAYVIGYRKALDDVAERMPEGVQKLVEEVKRLVREGDRRLRFQLAAKGDQAWADQMLDAIQRLEAAYSQKGAEIVRCAAIAERIAAEIQNGVE